MSREIITIDNNNNLHVVVETDAIHQANRTGSGAVPTLRRYNHKLKGGEVVVQAYHDVLDGHPSGHRPRGVRMVVAARRRIAMEDDGTSRPPTVQEPIALRAAPTMRRCPA
eukprot:gene28932-35886_t